MKRVMAFHVLLAFILLTNTADAKPSKASASFLQKAAALQPQEEEPFDENHPHHPEQASEEAADAKEESPGERKTREWLAEHAPWLTSKVKAIIQTLLIYGSFLIFFLACLRILKDMWFDYREIRKNGSEEEYKERPFSKFLNYRFGYWFVWTDGATGIVVSVASLFILIVGAFIYSFFVSKGILISTWNVFVWLVAPDAGAGEATWAGCFVGAILSIAGLVIFALVLTVLQEAFTGYLDGLKEGLAPVVESNHILLLGLTDDTIPVLKELVTAYEDEGGQSIVILSDELSKVEMEDKINGAGVETQSSKIVVRNGKGENPDDLIKVCADSAKTVVIMADNTKSKEFRDAFVLQNLVSLRSEGWPTNGKIVCVCSMQKNCSMFKKIGGADTDVVLLDQFLSKLMVECSSEVGLSSVVSNTIGFGSSEFYIKKTPEKLVGKAFYEASFYFPDGVLAGILDNSGSKKVTICPDKAVKLKADDDILVLAENSEAANAAAKSYGSGKVKVPKERRAREATSLSNGEPETFVIIGWNEEIGLLLLDLDDAVGNGTQVHILAPKPTAEREELLTSLQSRYSRDLKNITKIEHTEGPIGSRFALESIPFKMENASRIFVLGDQDAPSARHADACTLATVLQLRDMLMSEGKIANIPIVPQILDTAAEKYCGDVRATDFIDTSSLPSKVLAEITYNARKAQVLHELTSSDGSASFAITKLSDYLKPDEKLLNRVNFFEVQALVGTTGDVALGWSIPLEETSYTERCGDASKKGEFHRMMEDTCSEVHPKVPVVEWELNPSDKLKHRAWTESDRIAVLSSQ